MNGGTHSRLGVDRVLTSGREANAWEGRAVISRLVEASDGRIAIMAGAPAGLRVCLSVSRVLFPLPWTP